VRLIKKGEEKADATGEGGGVVVVVVAVVVGLRCPEWWK
jgi:hypothetical protein